MIEPGRLSSHYDVRTLKEADIEDILGICIENTLFYQYCNKKPCREEILNDMHIAPPNIDAGRKHYIGFFLNGELIAVMDLIDGYPAPETAYIGFFMVKSEVQGKQVGSSIVRDVLDYLRKTGKTAVRLAINKGNPQSSHFWEKNGFSVIKEVEKDEGTLLVAEQTL